MSSSRRHLLEVWNAKNAAARALYHEEQRREEEGLCVHLGCERKREKGRRICWGCRKAGGRRAA